MTCWRSPVNSFICPKATRSGLERCLRRHGVGNLGELKPAQPAPVSKTFKTNEPGYLHVDLKYLSQMQDQSSRRYLGALPMCCEATDSKAGGTWSRRCCSTWPCTTTNCPSQR